MRHCRLLAARFARRRDVLAKLMLVRSSRPLFFPRGSRTVGVRRLPRESRSAWRPRFVDFGTVEKQRCEAAILGALSKHRAVWPAVLCPLGEKIVVFFHRRTVRESGPERAPRGELGEVLAAGQRGRLSDRRAATESTTLPFCVVFESRASYNSRFATTELGLLCL